MVDVLDEPEARLVAIIEGSLDVSAMSARAQALAITSGLFQRAPNNAQLRDPRFFTENTVFDRRYALRWLESRDEDAPDNESDGDGLIRATVVLEVGYLHGPALGHLTTTTGSETQAANAVDTHRRALAEAERIKRALVYHELHQGAPATDPSIRAVIRAAPSRLEVLTDERLIAATVYDLVLSIDHSKTYGP